MLRAVARTGVVLLMVAGPAAAQSLTPWGSTEPFFERRPSTPPPEVAPYDPYWDDLEGSPAAPSGPKLLNGGEQPEIIAEAPPVVPFAQSFPANSVVIDSEGRRLYYVLEGSKAFEYPISVGREGFAWYGSETISQVASWPDWHPPAEMRRRDPKLPEKMSGGLRNPLGAKALYLGATLYRIHGTNDPKTIGQAASSGCFRMMNEHVVHLASIAGTGTLVTVVKTLPPPVIAEAPVDDSPFDTRERSALGGPPEAEQEPEPLYAPEQSVDSAARRIDRFDYVDDSVQPLEFGSAPDDFEPNVDEPADR